MNSDTFQLILVALIPGVSAIIVHEVSHGLMASRLGDPTAREAGRLSLNPLRHIDPLGTILIPGLMILAQLHFVFGWAKPVPVNFRRLRNVRWGTFLVALAGPLSNLVMTFCWLALLWSIAVAQAFTLSPGTMAKVFAQMAYFGVIINVALMLLNLIPLPPLDGGRIMGALLPEALSKPYMKLERFGVLILILLIVTGVFEHIFNPMLEYSLSRLGIGGL
jgi:Zn-dependent protease